MADIFGRRATADDYQGVLAIGEIYSGLDYLPQFYHKLLQDPSVYSYVCIADGEIVSYVYFMIVDNGSSVVFGAMRTKQAMRNQNCSRLLRKFALEDLAAILLKITPSDNIVYTTRNTPKALKVIEEKNKTIVLQRGVINYWVHTDNIKHLLHARKCDPDFKSKILQLEDISELILKNDERKEQLFPGNKIITFMVPFEATVENMKHIVTLFDPLVSAIMDGELCSSFATLTLCPVQKGLLANIDYYGNSIRELMSMMKEYLEYIVLNRKYEGDVAFDVFIPAHLNMKEFSGLMEEAFGWKKGPHYYVDDEFQLTVIDTTV